MKTLDVSFLCMWIKVEEQVRFYNERVMPKEELAIDGGFNRYKRCLKPINLTDRVRCYRLKHYYG